MLSPLVTSPWGITVLVALAGWILWRLWRWWRDRRKKN